MKHLKYHDFPLQTHDKIRYADTDRQGHVNNAAFASYLETGRAELMYHPDYSLIGEGASFVIVSLSLNFLKEINWPGRVDIGTGILKVGNSSITLYQQLFQNGECVATAESVIVQVDNDSGQSSPLTEIAREALQKWMLGSGPGT